MESHRIWLAALLAACGCQLLPGVGIPLGGTSAVAPAPVQAASASTTGGTGGTPPPNLEPAQAPRPSPPGDPLRDPRERRLHNVRQLTRSRLVAMPHFSPDGKWIDVAEKRANGIVLLRVSTSESDAGIVATQELPFPESGGLLWGLMEGRGEPCAVSSQKACAHAATDGGWPNTESLLACGGASVSSLPLNRSAAAIPDGDFAPGCPPAKGALPCAFGAQGAEVCPEQVDGGTRLALFRTPSAIPVPIGPTAGSSWMPALSRSGNRLVFVTQQSERQSHLMVSFIDHADPQPESIGPEATRTLDPTFSPAGDRVVFASTADDAAGQELDLMMVGVIGGALERITFASGVDRFPVFSPDGHSIAWVSERNADAHAQDLFIAEWVEP